MPSPALQRLEALLQARKLDVTLTPPWECQMELAPTGLPTVDAPLGGGWRRGEVSEIVGPRSSGRTSVLLATLATATARGEVVAVVDAVDRFDPVSAAAAGVDLTRVLWVRGPAFTVELARSFVIDQAVQQALRASDLIVRAGGFSIVALDVADVPSRYLRALPLTTWLRLAHANEGRATACLLVGEAPMGRSARGVTVALEAAGVWRGASAQSRQFRGLTIRPAVVRSTHLAPAAWSTRDSRDAGVGRRDALLSRS